MSWKLAATNDLGSSWVISPGMGLADAGAGANDVLPKKSRRASLSRSKRQTGVPSETGEATTDQCDAVPSHEMSGPIDDEEFAGLVDAHYESLYRFAFSLAHSEADARDLVQETFARLARKGSQLKSLAKAKSWLFTTLYRTYVDAHRQRTRHPHVDIEMAESELPATQPACGEHLDAATVHQALSKVDEVFRFPLILFYLDQHSYLEIAEILNIPPGTVMSRISRGRAQLRRMFEEQELAPLASGASEPGVVS